MADEPSETPKRRRAPAKPKADKPAPKPARASKAKATAAPKEGAAAKPAATRRKPATQKPAAEPKRAAPKKAVARKAEPAPVPAAPLAPEREAPATADLLRANASGLLAALGTLAVAGSAFLAWRATRAEQTAYEVLERDGAIELRRYPQMVTAGTEQPGERRVALENGFRILADYIFAKSRPGEQIPMTAPVLVDTDGDGSWRTRFVMPAGRARADLPSAPAGVELEVQPGARVAAIRFSGVARDTLLEARENALRSWLQMRGLPFDGKAVHAFYNAPFVPGPLRRNEVLITLSSEGGTHA